MKTWDKEKCGKEAESDEAPLFRKAKHQSLWGNVLPSSVPMTPLSRNPALRRIVFAFKNEISFCTGIPFRRHEK